MQKGVLTNVVIERFTPKPRDAQYLVCPKCGKLGRQYSRYKTNTKLFYNHPLYTERYVDKETGKILGFSQHGKSCYIGVVRALEDMAQTKEDKRAAKIYSKMISDDFDSIMKNMPNNRLYYNNSSSNGYKQWN
jgi:replicative superfamily II helicase